MRSAANPPGWPAMPGPDGTGPDAMVPGEAPGTASATGGITVGVEEEFMLLDPSGGTAVLAGPDLARMLGGEPAVQQELMRFQVETVTPVYTSLDDLSRELARLRRLVADAAASVGCRLVASGIAPYRTPGLAAITDQPRYRKMARRYGPLLAEAGSTCGCHVHVGVPSRDLGVQVLARLRPWLAPLLAITVNSPIADGHDTAWASSRYRAWSRWPTARPPAAWPDAAAYDAAVRGLIGRGAALDEQGIYLLARLSPRYPTVEVRVADACLDAGTAVLLAGLTRALVATALAETRQGIPVPAVPARWVNAALAAAARHGLAGPGVDPFTGQAADARSLRSRLLDHAYPALSDRGDTQTITRVAAPARRPGHRGRPAASPPRQRRVRARVHRGTRPRHAIWRRAGPRRPAEREIRAAAASVDARAGSRRPPPPGAITRRYRAPTALCTGAGQRPLTLNAATWHNRQTSARFPDLETSSYASQKARSRADRRVHECC